MKNTSGVHSLNTATGHQILTAHKEAQWQRQICPIPIPQWALCASPGALWTLAYPQATGPAPQLAHLSPGLEPPYRAVCFWGVLDSVSRYFREDPGLPSAVLCGSPLS